MGDFVRRARSVRSISVEGEATGAHPALARLYARLHRGLRARRPAVEAISVTRPEGRA